MSKKKEVKIEKMDVVSRRRFIRDLGFFLGTLSVTSMVRLETMEKISRKILGSSVAFAQGTPNEDTLVFHIYNRGGYPLRNLIGLLTDDEAEQHPDNNVQYAVDQMTRYNDTGGNPLILPSGSAPLAPYRTSTHFVNLFNSMGHRDALGSAPYNHGTQGNVLIWAAQQFQSPALVNSLYFKQGGSPSDNDMMSMPASMAAHHPEFHGSIASLTGKFSKLDLTTRLNNTMTEEQRDALFELMNAKFAKDVEKAIRTAENQDVMKDNSDKSYSALKVDLSQALDPDQDDTGTMDALEADLGGFPGKFGTQDMQPVRSFYSFARAAELGVTNNVALLEKRGGDWHGNNDRQGENPNAIQITNMSYLAQSIRNILDSQGTWRNPNTDNEYKILVVVTSEFFRGLRINGTDNPDGGSNGVALFGSDPSVLNGIKPGSFGGMNASTGQRMGVDANGDLTNSTSAWSHGSLRMLIADAQGVDRSALGLSDDNDTAEVNAALKA